jgi:hypothetical protein
MNGGDIPWSAAACRRRVAGSLLPFPPSEQAPSSPRLKHQPSLFELRLDKSLSTLGSFIPFTSR